MRALLGSLLLLLPAASALSEAPAVDALLEAEARFSSDSAELGLREGFLAHLIEESVVFRPLPTAAKEWFQDQEPLPFTLTWRPWFAEMAASGDFGYIIGAWESRPLPENASDMDDAALDADDLEADESGGADPTEVSPAASHGFYVTVWIKGEDGEWHPLADHGIGGLPEPAMPESTQALGAERSAPIQGSFRLNTRYQGLMAATMRLPSGQLESNIDRAWLAEDLRVLRPGREPILGHEAVRLVASGELGASAPALVVMAASGDLGMSLGGEPDTGAYLRLWRHLEGAGWVLATEVATPVQLLAADAADDASSAPDQDDSGS